MRRAWHDHRLFWRELRRDFSATGAVLPSGRRLSAALARYVDATRPTLRVLEVGPGTGAVTRRIAARMHADARLDLVEANPAFATRLDERIRTDRAFRKVAPRVRVLPGYLEEQTLAGDYDVVISGLPLNNFSPQRVAELLDCLRSQLAPGGTLSFFEYCAIRSFRGVVAERETRARLRGIAQTLREVLREGRFDRRLVWANVPPAWVHHLRFRPSNPITELSGAQ